MISNKWHLFEHYRHDGRGYYETGKESGNVRLVWDVCKRFSTSNSERLSGTTRNMMPVLLQWLLYLGPRIVLSILFISTCTLPLHSANHKGWITCSTKDRYRLNPQQQPTLCPNMNLTQIAMEQKTGKEVQTKNCAAQKGHCSSFRTTLRTFDRSRRIVLLPGYSTRPESVKDVPHDKF